MEDAHSAIIGIPDQKETGSLKEQIANFVTNLKEQIGKFDLKSWSQTLI